ncbi:uncharacterized protein IL334_002758 [Kwoniella shivajii]|uniref:SET domain-containing protein n=1 Tax=Kwoniella shivajii TaxID=564305 RepID=A0ABZ1CXB5_9TREE|nr:hypothetical protein IL334_002758 [Kwoniella shivajii]
MQDISFGLEPTCIPLIGKPTPFTYITDSVFSDSTSISSQDKGVDSGTWSETSADSGDNDSDPDDDEVITCSCVPDENSKSLCTVNDGDQCDCVSGYGNFYTTPTYDDTRQDWIEQRLEVDALPERLPLIECSVHCPCAEGCSDRLTQTGVRVSVTVQISTSGIGYGLFYTPTSNVKLSKGSFISLYAGEYLTTPEARIRWSDQATNQKQGEGNYILTLKISSSNEIWHIDPRNKGNIGRFLNHSCEPNCIIQIVRWGVTSLFRAAIFTKRYIKKGEELTFDYANASGSPLSAEDLRRTSGNERLEVREKRTRCLCGTQTCRGWMPFDETL